MQVLSVRVGKTINTGNYSSLKLELEASPSDGQTADQLLAEVGEYLDKQAIAATTGLPETVKPAAKSEPSSKPPLGNNASGKAKSQAALSNKSGESKDSDYANGAADAMSKPAETIIDNPPKKTRAKKSDAPTPAAMEKELKFALDSETLEELADRFNKLRGMAKHFEVKDWDAANSQLAGVYRKLNSPVADPDIQSQLIAAFKSEKTYIEEKLSRNEEMDNAADAA